jgi:hypothetical protein
MSDAKVRAALETRLNAMVPALATAWENSAFMPVTGTPYQRVHVLRAEPENPTYDSFRRLLGFMQVTLMYPQAEGPGAAEARAELIRAQFPKGLALANGGVTVTVDKTPYVLAGAEEEDRWVLPVRVPYFANIP